VTNREPMVGEELIRLSLEAFHVQLQFENMVLEIGVAFRVNGGVGDAVRIDPVTHDGDVGPLWSLIGERGTPSPGPTKSRLRSPMARVL
jgi:hypothetical protein